MRAFFFSLFFLTLFGACQKEHSSHEYGSIRISKRVEYSSQNDEFYLKSGKFEYHFNKKSIPVRRIILLNASLVGYFSALGAEDKIVGISSPEYIFSPKIQNLLVSGAIQNIGNEQKYNVEKIIGLKPDVIFSNYISSFENTYKILRNSGINLVFLDEYAEQNPLEKSAYLKVFGMLLGKEDLANAKYHLIEESYRATVALASKSVARPAVLANEMYGNQWFLPGGKTALANYVRDANADYINKDNNADKAVPMSFEEVLTKAGTAEFWVNVGNHHAKKELLAINPNYAKMKVFNQGKLYSVTRQEKGKANDFFENGVYRADLVLKDYVKIFHPELLTDYELTYFQELK